MLGHPPRRRRVEGRGRSSRPLRDLAAQASGVEALGLPGTGLAAVCCRPASGPAFAAAREQLAVVIAPRANLVHWEWDAHGLQWALLASKTLHRLAIAAARSERALAQRGFGNLLISTVFALVDAAGQPVQLVYDHRLRGFYPFVPGPGRTRDEAAERDLATALSPLLPVVADTAQWAGPWDSPLVDRP